MGVPELLPPDSLNFNLLFQLFSIFLSLNAFAHGPWQSRRGVVVFVVRSDGCYKICDALPTTRLRIRSTVSEGDQKKIETDKFRKERETLISKLRMDTRTGSLDIWNVSLKPRRVTP
jgi:hypothetical protein